MATAALSADWELRGALLEGCALFAVAVSRAAGRGGRKGGPFRGAPGAAHEGLHQQEAMEVVGVLQQRMERAMRQVGNPK